MTREAITVEGQLDKLLTLLKLRDTCDTAQYLEARRRLMALLGIYDGLPSMLSDAFMTRWDRLNTAAQALQVCTPAGLSAAAEELEEARKVFEADMQGMLRGRGSKDPAT